MVKFWDKLFGINFALGVTTGLTMEFQLDTNWGLLQPLHPYDRLQRTIFHPLAGWLLMGLGYFILWRASHG